MKDKDIRVRIKPALHARLKAEAVAQDRSMNWLITRAIEEMLNKKPR